jgi:hypothetical protein
MQEYKMNNYTIDGSVFTYPFHNKQPDFTEVSNLYRDVKNLHFILFEKQDLYYKQAGCKRYFLLHDDIKLIMEFRSLYSSNTVHPGTASKNLYEIRRINSKIIAINNTIDKIFGRLGYKTINKIKIDTWFDIENIIFKPDKEPLLPSDILNKITDNKQRENFRKNLAITAALHKYVYKRNDIHGLIISSNIPQKDISLQNVVFDIAMKQGKYNDAGNTYNFSYMIKDLPAKDIHIDNHNITLSTMDVHKKDNITYESIDEAYTNAKNDFKVRLKFGFEVDSSIKEYTDKINAMSAKYPSNTNEGKDIAKWMKIFPDILYENLKTLSDSMDSMDLKATGNNISERCHCCRDKIVNGRECHINICVGSSCKEKCDFLETCGSYIHYFGADCVDEYNKNDNRTKFIKKDRNRIDSQGIKSPDSMYWHHLRLKTVPCDDQLYFLALRIYFRQLLTGQIEIGWIGRHLYSYCRNKYHISDCNRPDCRRNPNSPLHDPILDDYQNFLKEWA